MATVTLATLRSRVRERADLVNSNFVTDTSTSLDAFINASLDELYDVLATKFSNPYFVASTALTTVAGTSSYALPSDFYKLLGVDLPFNGTSTPLKEFNFADRGRYQLASSVGQLPSYRLEGSNLRLYPVPASVLAGTLWYVPTRPQLSLSTDSVAYPNGWEEYAVIDAAIKCMAKEETDPSALFAAKAAILQRIAEAAENRNQAEPEKAVDVESCDAELSGRYGSPY